MAVSLTKLIYVGDPMCSWCWGFAPVIESLASDYPVEVVVGGLRPGPSAQALDERMAGYLRRTWADIRERTGQPFDTDFLDDNDAWVYDTEPAAVAVTLMRELNEPETLGYFTSIQHAFYAEGMDVTDYEVLAALTADHGVTLDQFAAGLEDGEARKNAWADFSRARNWGIGGFPTLVGELADERLALLARGWTEETLVRARIESLDELEER